MEFYIWLVKSFCTPQECIYSVFASGKLTCAAVVSVVVVDQRSTRSFEVHSQRIVRHSHFGSFIDGQFIASLAEL